MRGSSGGPGWCFGESLSYAGAGWLASKEWGVKGEWTWVLVRAWACGWTMKVALTLFAVSSVCDTAFSSCFSGAEYSSSSLQILHTILAATSSHLSSSIGKLYSLFAKKPPAAIPLLYLFKTKCTRPPRDGAREFAIHHISLSLKLVLFDTGQSASPPAEPPMMIDGKD